MPKGNYGNYYTSPGRGAQPRRGISFAFFPRLGYSREGRPGRPGGGALSPQRNGGTNMLFLVLATLSSSVLALVLKRLDSGNTYGVYFFNYVTCALLSFLTLEDKALWRGDPPPLWLGAVGGLLPGLSGGVWVQHPQKRGDAGLCVHPAGGAGAHRHFRGLSGRAPLLAAGGGDCPGGGCRGGDERPAPGAEPPGPGAKALPCWPCCSLCSSTAAATACLKSFA